MHGLYHGVKALALLFLLLVAFVIGQATQYHFAKTQRRFDTLQSWIYAHPEQEAPTLQFIDRCIRHPPRLFGSNKKLSLYECGESLGAYDLVDTLAQSERANLRAWPLSELLPTPPQPLITQH